MKKKLVLISILHFLCFSITSQSPFTIEGESSLNDFNLNNLTISNGKAGKKIIILTEAEYYPEPDTDFLIHFNNNAFIDEAENYYIDEHYNNISNIEKKYGDSSAYFFKNKGIKFSSKSESMFSKGRVIRDFSIEFWIYPTTIDQDTSLFLWKGVNKVEEQFIKQIIKCYFEDRHIVWEFQNVFTPEDFKEYSIELKGKSRLIPQKWSHHLIRYRSGTGMLEYLMNGIPEDIKFTTPTFKENHKINSPYIGNFSKNEFFIGDRYRGFIDEFRISEAFIEKPNLDNFSNSGKLISPVYDINEEKINFKSISIKDFNFPETAAYYYYRISENPFLSSDKNLKWNKLVNNNINIKGRYIQIYADFFSSGDNSKTPYLEKIDIHWDSIPKPPAPISIEVTPEKNSLKLDWLPVKHHNVKGYYIYIGDKSNNYQEIIDVKDKSTYTINNLQSNKIYYITIKSYNSDRESDFSNEVFSRPK